MFSVTQRIKMVKQPLKGFIPPDTFIEKQLVDNANLAEVNASVKSIQGMAVDYLTRYIMGCPKEEAFAISLKGAELVSESNKAKILLNQINGTDDLSIKSACILVGYDVAFRRGPSYFVNVNEDIIDQSLVSNISDMIKRSCIFLQENGPIVMCGFTMEEGYNDIVSSGDGDYITKTTLWDFKVSSLPLNKNQTLQLAMYYIIGIHSVHSIFKKIKYLGIYNPFLNKTYKIKISSIDDSVFSSICRDVIGYITPETDSKWKMSYGTNSDLLNSIQFEMYRNAFKDTGFRPQNYGDGIYDISVDDYWSFYRTIIGASYVGPTFRWTKSVKFLKHHGYYMFVSVSPKGHLSVLKGGALKSLKRPLEYYFERMPEYGNLIMQKFSAYWNSIYHISSQIKSIEPDKEFLKKQQYREYKRRCQAFGTPVKDFEKWYEEEIISFKFKGTVHGCIVDFDYTNHIFLNPSDGTITPYSAVSMYEKYVYNNISSLIASQRPEMLNGYEKTCKISSQETTNLLTAKKKDSHELAKIDNHIVRYINQDGIKSSTNERINEHTYLITSTDMYRISNRIKELQMIYDNQVIAAWYDNFLPNMEIKGKTEPKLKSILLQSAEMNCGMIATVICDNGYKDITVKFEDGTIVEHKTRQQFHNRTIKKPNLKDKQTKKTVNSCVGQSLKMHCGLVATVIEDNGCMDITVKFEDGLIRKHCRRDKFREGKIAHKDDSVK